MTEHGDHGWFDDDWDDDGDADDLWGSAAAEPPGPPGTPLRSGDDALAVLLDLVGPERAGAAALWFLLLDADARPLPLVVPIVDVPVRPDRAVARRLMEVIDAYLSSDAPGGSVVAGLVRAAGGDLGAFEALWVPALREAADDAGVQLWAVVAIGAGRARVLEW